MIRAAQGPASQVSWLKRIRQAGARASVPRVPPHLARRQRQANAAALAGVRDALERCLFENEESGNADDYVSSPGAQTDMQLQLHARLEYCRTTVIPWLDRSKQLHDARILEIGCGTGSSTIPLAEQARQVIAVDVDGNSLSAAKVRAAAYGLDNIRFIASNGRDICATLPGQHFDFVIFYACLEHMTHEERLAAMASTWHMLRPGDAWVVVDTPNRLWPYDSHTSQLPFFTWLPDDLALKYARFSSRPFFRDLHPGRDDATGLARWGRGVSYHEFELVMGPLAQLRVSALRQHLRRHSFVRRLRDWHSADRRVERMLVRLGPARLPAGFCQPYLDLLIEKR